MSEALLWQIGLRDAVSPDLADTYKNPHLLGESVTWHAGSDAPQKWPLFHPSEADPEAGYRPHTYAVEFHLEQEPAGAYALRISYLVIAPRLAHLRVGVNGVEAMAYLRPKPSQSGEIRLLSGLHTTIYSDGELEVVVPAGLLRMGANRLELTAVDGGEFLAVENIERVRRLDRMANGAGLLYKWIGFYALQAAPPPGAVRVEIEPGFLYKRGPGGALREHCDLYVELSGATEASPLRLTLEGDSRVEELALSLPAAAFGHLHLPVDMFDGDGPVVCQLRGEAGGRPVHHEGILRRKRKWKVFITPHAHTDIGYTHRQWEVAERLCRNIDAALDLLQSAPGSFSYHLDSSWAVEAYLQTRGPERHKQLMDAVRAGKIGVAANYVDLLTHTSALEDLVRNLEVTDEMLGPHGLRSDFASVVDVASITSAFPAVLSGAGVRYLAHANNQDRGPFRLNGGLHRASPFWWEGPGGGRILVWLSKMYCELRKVCGSPPLLASAGRGLSLWLQEYDHGQYAPDAVLLYGQEADNTDLDPQPADFVRQWNQTYAYPQLIPSDVSSFFRYVEQGWADRFPVLRGDGGAYWEDGAGSSINQTMQARGAQAALPAAERLEALAAVHNPDWAFPSEQYDQAWRELLLYDEHTWGAFLSATEPDALLARDQWDVKENFAAQSRQWARRLLHVAATRHSLCWNNAGREVVIYNPHSWTVSGSGVAEIEPAEQLVDPETGEPVPQRTLQLLPTQKLVEFWADGVTGLSYRRLGLRRTGAAGPGAGGAGQAGGPAGPEPAGPEPAGAEPVVLENWHYRLVIDPRRGCVTSWVDKQLPRDLVDGSDPRGLGQLVYALGGEGTRLMGNQSDLPEGNPELLDGFELFDSQVEYHGLGTALTLRGRVACGELEVEWYLPHRARRVDVRYRLHKREVRDKEAVYIAFPLALPGAQVHSDAQLGWVNWHTGQLPGGCKEWLPLQTSILAESGGVGVQIASPDIPLFCVGDVVRGRWPKEADLTGGRIFSYVLNNYWHTNYKASQGGEIAFRYSLTSGGAAQGPGAPGPGPGATAPALDRAAACRFGWEARRPLYAHRISFQDFRPDRAPYDRPAGGALANIGSENVILSTMRAARGTSGFLLRLQEIGGTDGLAPVAFPGRRVSRAWKTDLLGHNEEPVPVQPDGSLLVAVPAWGLATVRIEF